MSFLDPGGVFAYLTAFSETFKRDYVPNVFPQTMRHGATTRFLDLSERTLDGVHMEYEVDVHPNRGTVMTTDAHAAAPDHTPGRYGRFVLKWDETDPTKNDFGFLMTGLSKTFYTDQKNSDGNWKPSTSNLAKDFQEMLDDVKENFARSFHIPTSGLIGVVDTGGKKDDDSFSWDDAGTYTSSSTSAKLLVQHTPMSLLPVGQLIEIRDTSNDIVVNHVEITRNEPHEFTIDVRLTAKSVDNGGAAVTDLDDVAATDRIYLQGGYNQNTTNNLQSFFDESQTYFRTPDGTAIDRTLPVNKWAMPRVLNAAAGSGHTSVDLTPRHIRRAGRMLAFEEGDGNAIVNIMSIMNDDGFEQLTKLDKDKLIKMMPASQSDVGAQIREAFGFNGFVWHDPNIGVIPAVVDDFAAYGAISLLHKADWEIAVPFAGGFQMVDVGGVGGMWHNISEASTGRPSLKFYARGVMSYCPVCTRPSRQVQIQNLNKEAAA